VFIADGKGGHQRLVPVSQTFFATVAHYLNAERPADASTDRVFVALKGPTRGDALSAEGLDEMLSNSTDGIALTSEGVCVSCAPMEKVELSDVERLVDVYRAAARSLDAIGDPVEREVGQSALRLSATGTLRHLSTRAEGVTADALEPLRTWLNDYVQGGRAEKSVDYFDKKAIALAGDVMTTVTGWAFSGAAIFSGVIGIVAGLYLNTIDAGVTFGQALVSGVIPGVVFVYALRAMFAAPGTALATWNEASSLGLNSEKVLHQTSVPVERELWRVAGGAPYPGVPFTAKARVRAQALLGIAFLSVIVGVLAFGSGVWHAISTYDPTAVLGS
jgi:hypothetical protein